MTIVAPDLLLAFRQYVFKMLAIPSLDGMKALIMDEEATKMLGLTTSLTEIINRDVVIVGKLSKGLGPDATGTSLQAGNAQANTEKGATRHLKCAVILRPTTNSIQALCQQLRHPQFHSYYIFFTNNISDDLLRPIAEADHQFELVRQVHIYYFDYYPLEPQLFIAATSPQQYPIQYFPQPRDYWPGYVKTAYDRNLETILSLILTIKAHPIIRTSNSKLALSTANDITKRMQQHNDLYLFPQSNNEASTLLLLDRRDDPITPLLLNWSYLSMINELFPIDNGRVDLRSVPNIDPDLKEITLSTIQDKFFAANIYSGFGDIASNAKKLVDDYKSQKQAATGKMDTLEDIRSAVEKVPELKQMAGTVSKHMTMLMELNRQIKASQLYQISELTQDMACENNHTAHIESMKKMLYNSPQVKFESKLYMIMLYALKYEHEPTNKINEFKTHLRQAYPSNAHKITAIDAVVQTCGAKNRSANSSLNLSHGRSFFDKMTSKMSSSVKGYENVHTRHRPLLLDIIEQFSTKRAKVVDYPQTSTFAFKAPQNATPNDIIAKPQYLYIYILGGATYAEAAAVHQFNNSSPDFKVVLGGSCMLNSKTFINSLIGEDKNVAAAGGGGADDATIDML